MQITQEQERAMFDGATHKQHTRNGVARCEQKHCSIWRMSQTWVQVMRMRRAGKLDSWNYYTEAKNNNRLLFINPTEKVQQ